MINFAACGPFSGAFSPGFDMNWGQKADSAMPKSDNLWMER
jgi:hypothetical protein